MTSSNNKAKAVSIDEVLLQATSACEALGGLYRLRKSQRKSYSLALLAKAAGISSKSYLSEAIKGKRTISRKHKLALSRALKLEGLSRACFEALVDLDSESTPGIRHEIETRLQTLKKALGTAFLASTPAVHDLATALEVYCAFGLFGGKPTRKDLTRLLATKPPARVMAALDSLISAEIVGVQGETLFLLKANVVFIDSGDRKAQQLFLQEAITEACTNVDNWFGEPTLSHFESSIISVRTADYRQLLSGIKDACLQLQAGLENPDADALIRFNIQIYPCHLPP